ncbi:MAG TPA: [Fe-Fe] hydrogenase large subunit C-terminal domain-containing protein [Synergistales bacterium]|nr:[Fe-Fe] hydrogenase large subunit C-terminal domain-containing protein [Synergistales bacterium]
MPHGIKISGESCRGCVNCIKACPTEAMRVIHGQLHIIDERCIACGECLRICRHRAISLEESEWNSIAADNRSMPLVTDPALCTQFSWPPDPGILKDILMAVGFEPIFEDTALAFDLAAMAQARILDEHDSRELPMISTYCPSVVRLIQIRFPELIHNLSPAETPLETSVDLWRTRHNRYDIPSTLVAPCPARITMAIRPVGRETSSIDNVVSTARVAKEILSKDCSPSRESTIPGRDSRWVHWSVSGGEAGHIRMFEKRPLKTLAVSGLRNVVGILQEIELRRLKGVDFIEARMCDMGCIGGIANAESPFLSRLKVEDYPFAREIDKEEMAILEDLYQAGVWKLQQEILPIEQIPLGKDMAKAMEKLSELQSVYAELPHLDCGTCGRPTCRVMAEDIVRGEASLDDCIFRLRKRMGDLSQELNELSKRFVHTMTPEGKE